MDLRQYARTLRANWFIILAAVLLCAGAAGVLAWVRAPTYSAQADMFVSTAEGSTSAGDAYEGGLFAQQRVLSYARLVTSRPVLQAVIDELSLDADVDGLRDRTAVSVPTGTVVIEVTVQSESPEEASEIANALARYFAAFVPTLETPEATGGAPVNVVVASPAQVPTSPVAPNQILYYTLGALLGLMLGVGAAVVRQALDDRLRYAEDVEDITGAPVMGVIAEDGAARQAPLSVISAPHSRRSEAYRRLRTNVRALRRDRHLGTFVVSSAAESEGKTITSANLGIALAQAGYSVVLVDADLRRQGLSELMRASPSIGLTSILADGIRVATAVRTWREGLPLEVLAAGPQRDSPSELLASERFRLLMEELGSRADAVIVDAPALLPVGDAAIAARAASGVILVARLGLTRREDLETATRALRTAGADIVGVVLNRLRGSARTSYRKGGYAGATSAEAPAGPPAIAAPSRQALS